MKSSRKFTGLIVAVLTLLLLMGAKYPEPTTEFFVNDYANVIEASAESYIMEKSAALYQQTGAQIVVLTVDSLDGADAASYALNVARQWGIGSSDKNNGLLVLLAVGDREIRVEVGKGLEGALNDAKVGRLIDKYAIPLYQNNDFGAGTLELYNGLLSQVMVEYGMEALPGYQPVSDESGGISLVDIVIILLILGVFLPMFMGKNKRRPPGSGSSGGSHGGYYGGFGGFGGFGGGNSGSGGGFGGFSGGGGGFGGGGAGRRF